MKLHLDSPAGTYRITAYGPGFISVNDERVTRSVIVTPEQLIRDWPPQCFADLDPSCVRVVEELAPAIALLGTGKNQTFPESTLLAVLTEKGIGVEVMTTAAACRTYNILVGEGRNVAAMLLPIEE